MAHRWLALSCILVLAGCAAGPTPVAEPARFDLGPVVAEVPMLPGIGRVEVNAPSWLGGTAMQYRLAYADAARRQDYAGSRWAAPPAELLERALARQLTSGGICRLTVALDEFVQVFDSAQSSSMLVEARVTLLAGQQAVAQHAFAVAPAAPSADARGGVDAAAMAVQTLRRGMAQWLAQTLSDGQPGATACQAR